MKLSMTGEVVDMWYYIIWVVCFLANPVVFLVTVLACAVICSPIAVYLWRLERKDKQEWAASMAKRAEWQAEAEVSNKRVASETWERQVDAYSKDLPRPALGGYEAKSFAVPKCFDRRGG